MFKKLLLLFLIISLMACVRVRVDGYTRGGQLYALLGKMGDTMGSRMKKSCQEGEDVGRSPDVPRASQWTRTSVTYACSKHRMKWDTGRAIRLLGPG